MCFERCKRADLYSPLVSADGSPAAEEKVNLLSKKTSDDSVVDNHFSRKLCKQRISFRVVCVGLFAVFAIFCVLLGVRSARMTWKFASDEDMDRDFCGVVRAKGYNCTVHHTTTEDGFILAMYRMANTTLTKQSTVLLRHGLVDSAFTYIFNRPENSLPYILVDAGYDVWLSDVRGNDGSAGHTNFTISDDEYWDYTFQDIGNYDVPALVNYITSVAGVPKLTYIGHSQGTIEFWLSLNYHPELAERMNLFVGLAPVFTLEYVNSAFLKAIGQFLSENGRVLSESFQLKGIRVSHVLSSLASHFCHLSPYLCEKSFQVLAGEMRAPFDATRWEIYIKHYPSVTSVKNFIHWFQILGSNHVSQFDYKLNNPLVYNSTTPPNFSLSGINSNMPIALFYGGHDLLSTKADVEIWSKELSTSDLYMKYIDYYAHGDFLWALDANELIYQDILRLLKKHAPN